MAQRNLFPTFHKLKGAAYSYRWTAECETVLPEHYKERCLEFMMKDPSPVHWRPDPRKYKLDPKSGQRVPVQNHPIQVMYPQQCNDGLWGGEGIVQGYTKKKPNSTKQARIWTPQLVKQALYSEILDKWLVFIVTPRTLNLIDDAMGFDSYTLATHERDLNSKLAMKMKRLLLVTLAKQSLYPNDAEKREKILKKYSEYIMPLKEAEWVGLSISEALEKARKEYEEENPVVPLKLQMAEDLVAQLEGVKLPGQSEEEPGSQLGDGETKSPSLLQKVNPFRRRSTPNKWQ